METTKQFDSPEVKLHFLDYWRIIRIRKTVILAVFLLVTITTTVVTLILPKSYASTVRIAIEKEGGDVSKFGEARTITPYDPYWIQTEFEKIQSSSILVQVVTNLQLHKAWAPRFKETELPLDFSYRLLKNQMSVRQYRNTSLIEISVLNEIPKESATIANEIAAVYKNSRLERYKETARSGIKSLEDEKLKLDHAVDAKQKVVDKLKTDLNISENDAQGSTAMASLEAERVRKLDTARIEVQAQYDQIFTLYTYLDGLSRVELQNALPTASPDPQLNILVGQLNEAQQKLTVAEQHFGPQNPQVITAKSLISRIETQVEDRIKGNMQGLKARFMGFKASLEQMEQGVQDAKNQDIEAAINRRLYFLAKRDLEGLQTVRDRLQLKIQQEYIDSKIPISSIVEITDEAVPSLRAARPRVALNIALGVLVGLAVGVGLAFFIEYLDTSVKTIDDVERALQAPVLGVIPQNVGTLLEEGPDSPHAEAYRVLRTNFMFSMKDPKLNTITIVSAGAGEGKSTTTFNLATIFAQQGSRVLVVDSDLRRPSLHKILKVSNSIGLTNYLLKQNSLEEVIQTTPLPTMDFLPSGKLPSSSMGILSSAQMKELIRDLKRRYDYVFFDSPPIMGVSDASILASEVDCVMQVIQYRRYPQPMTIRAKQMIEKVGGNLLGIVLNNINLSSDENYYYYSGYYYDYYSKSEDSTPDHAASGAAAPAEGKVEIKPKY